MDNFLRLENRHTGEILRMRRVHDAQGQIVLNLDGSLPPRSEAARLCTCISMNGRRAS